MSRKLSIWFWKSNDNWQIKFKFFDVDIERGCDSSKYGFRENSNVVVPIDKKGIKRKCISIVGVKILHKTEINQKMCGLLMVFKRLLNKEIFEGFFFISFLFFFMSYYVIFSHHHIIWLL